MDTTYNLQLELVDIEEEGFHLLLEIMVNGKAARMVLDTGASRTVFDSNCINEFIAEANLIEEERLSTGLGSNALKSYSIVFESVEIGELEIMEYPIAVLDLRHVTESYNSIGKGEIHGVIGGDILLKYNAIIDYQKKILSLSI